MGSWCRNDHKAIWKLLDYPVDLSSHHWFTHNTRQDGSIIEYGRDFGGHVFLKNAFHAKIEGKSIFQSYSIQRYWLNDYPEWHAKAGKSLLTNGHIEIDGLDFPIRSYDLKELNILLDQHYAVAISFQSASEAMAFKLMI